MEKESNGNPFRNANVGNYVKFGRYPQTKEGEVRPVEWQVLAREDNKALVISRYGLDAKRFDVSSNNWDNSEIRKWLNGEFYNSVLRRRLVSNFLIRTMCFCSAGKRPGSILQIEMQGNARPPLMQRQRVLVSIMTVIVGGGCVLLVLLVVALSITSTSTAASTVTLPTMIAVLCDPLYG